MRKKIFILLIGLLLLTSKASARNTASVKNLNISVDGNVQSVSCYNIKGYNYFKLRDVAKLMMDTDKEFDLSVNSYGYPSVKRGLKYQASGSELEKLKSKKIKVNANFIFMYPEALDESYINPDVVKTYKIGGYNYISLRDIAWAANFFVGYDAPNKTITIDSAKDYVRQEPTRAEKVDTAIDYVYSILGTPYDELDCSGLVSSALSVGGFDVPGILYTWTLESFDGLFKEIPMNQLQKGDVLNKAGQHMMLYIGDGKIAESIETTGVRITKLRTKGYKAFRIMQ